MNMDQIITMKMAKITATITQMAKIMVTITMRIMRTIMTTDTITTPPSTLPHWRRTPRVSQRLLLAILVSGSPAVGWMRERRTL